MRFGVHFDAGGSPENVGAQAVWRVSGRMANLHEECPVILELQQMTIGEDRRRRSKRYRPLST